MIPLKEIKPKSATMKKSDDGSIKTSIEEASFKRNVSKTIEELRKNLQKEKSVEDHVHSVLME